MFTVMSLSLFKVSFGPSVTAVGRIGPGSAAGRADESPGELTLPWQDISDDPSTFSFLAWRTRTSHFKGRNAEMRRLEQWANGNETISIKFLTGVGGVGKSRLAAEFASKMQQEGWSAGFVDLRDYRSFPMNEAGTLLIVDYPEEHRQAVGELFRDLAAAGKGPRVRVLLLTRQDMEQWFDLVAECSAEALVDMTGMGLGAVDKVDSYELFCSAQERTAEVLKTDPQPVSREDFVNWIENVPGTERPLFVVATGVHSAIMPKEAPLGYSGREVVESLVEHELGRLRNASRAAFEDENAAARLLAIAALRGGISVNDVKLLAGRESLKLGLGNADRIDRKLQHAALVRNGQRIDAPGPDIVAACFVVKVLSASPDTAAELVWTAILESATDGVERIGRISYDSEVVLGMRDEYIRDWCVRAVEGNLERSRLIDDLIGADAMLPMGLLPMVIAAERLVLDNEDAPEKRARLLNNVSISLHAVGNAEGALHESVDIYRRLARANPAWYEPNLAGSLNNLSNHLRSVGDTQGALEASRESVDIYRGLARANPARYEQALAGSLNNLSNHLRSLGDAQGALEAIRKSVDIYRGLARANPARHEPDLAMGLNNLSDCLHSVGDACRALDVSRESVDIYRRLARANPARYAPELARSLSTLGTILLAQGDREEACQTFTEGVKLIELYAKRFPGSPAEKLHEVLLQLLRAAQGQGGEETDS